MAFLVMDALTLFGIEMPAQRLTVETYASLSVRSGRAYYKVVGNSDGTESVQFMRLTASLDFDTPHCTVPELDVVVKGMPRFREGKLNGGDVLVLYGTSPVFGSDELGVYADYGPTRSARSLAAVNAVASSTLEVGQVIYETNLPDFPGNDLSPHSLGSYTGITADATIATSLSQVLRVSLPFSCALADSIADLPAWPYYATAPLALPDTDESLPQVVPMSGVGDWKEFELSGALGQPAESDLYNSILEYVQSHPTAPVGSFQARFGTTWGIATSKTYAATLRIKSTLSGTALTRGTLQ